MGERETERETFVFLSFVYWIQWESGGDLVATTLFGRRSTGIWFLRFSLLRKGEEWWWTDFFWGGGCVLYGLLLRARTWRVRSRAPISRRTAICPVWPLSGLALLIKTILRFLVATFFLVYLKKKWKNVCLFGGFCGGSRSGFLWSGWICVRLALRFTRIVSREAIRHPWIVKRERRIEGAMRW